MANSWEKSPAEIANSEVLGRLHFHTAAFCGWYEAWATGCHRWKTDPVTIWVLRQCPKKVLYFGGSISCRLSESFSSVFPSISCQNIHKHVTKFLTQQHFVFSEKRNVFLRNHVILCDFVISLPSLYTPKCNSYCMQFLLYVLGLFHFCMVKCQWSRTVLSSVQNCLILLFAYLKNTLLTRACHC